MNTKNESIINTLSAQILSHFPEPVVLSIETTGHFWRNSYIESMTLVAYDQTEESWIGQTFSGEKEEDEFDMLTALSSFDLEGKTLFTFNGAAFALPYLKRKMKAYGLESSLDKASHVDLMNRYKEMSAVFGMPSYHLQDFMTFLEMPSEASMAQVFLALMSMESYGQALQIKLEEVELMDGEMPVFRYSVPYTFPKSISYRDGIYHVRFSGDTVSISMPIEDNSLRVYFTDPSEYYYLPQEGYAVHKSLSDFVDPSHRVKATRETCFTRLAFDDSFQKNKRRQINYLTSLISYLSVPFK